MSEKDAYNVDSMRNELEQMALSVYIDLMGNEKIDPTVRKSSADAVMKIIGKDAPPKQPNQPGQQQAVVLQFGSQLGDALKGITVITREATPLELDGGVRSQ